MCSQTLIRASCYAIFPWVQIRSKLVPRNLTVRRALYGQDVFGGNATIAVHPLPHRALRHAHLFGEVRLAQFLSFQVGTKFHVRSNSRSTTKCQQLSKFRANKINYPAY